MKRHFWMVSTKLGNFQAKFPSKYEKIFQFDSTEIFFRTLKEISFSKSSLVMVQIKLSFATFRNSFLFDVWRKFPFRSRLIFEYFIHWSNSRNLLSSSGIFVLFRISLSKNMILSCSNSPEMRQKRKKLLNLTNNRKWIQI